MKTEKEIKDKIKQFESELEILRKYGVERKAVIRSVIGLNALKWVLKDKEDDDKDGEA